MLDKRSSPSSNFQGLWERLALASPFSFPNSPTPVDPKQSTKPLTLLVYGASSTLGKFVVELARASPVKNLRILATASPRNHALVKSLGADEVFDYRSTDWVAAATLSAGGAVDLAFDCISEGETAVNCARTMGGQGGRLAVVEKGFNRDGIPENVTILPGLCWTGLGQRVEYTRAFFFTHFLNAELDLRCLQIVLLYPKIRLLEPSPTPSTSTSLPLALPHSSISSRPPFASCLEGSTESCRMASSYSG